MRKLQCKPLKDALVEMSIGETCIAPDGYSPRAIMVACCRLKEDGMLFQTSSRTGEFTITRIK